MEIVLVRHGQPDWEPGGRAVDEPGLTDDGHEQARRLAHRLAHEHFDALYSSPKQRVRETAQPTAERLGVVPLVRSWLREIELPSLEGRSPTEVQAYFRGVNARQLESHWDGPPGGESFRHFYERVSAGAEELLLTDHRLHVHQDGSHRLWRDPGADLRILVFAHEGTNSVIISHLLGLDPVPWISLRFPSAWAGITRLRLRPIAGAHIWTLDGFNQVDHLEDLAIPHGESGKSEPAPAPSADAGRSARISEA